MIEHAEPVLPPQVATAKEIITRLADFSQMTDEDNVLNNILAASEVFASEGCYSDFTLHSFSLDF